ncbi:MAG TPA: helicase-related protein [Paludibacteraceae bacterium]|nr:helicase-related protein [Paludibacteraceae bacterium]
MNNFITNSTKKQLRTRLIELLSKSEELKFLVGFFYFFGLRELYDGLQSNDKVKLKVLIGLNVDKTIHGLTEYGEKDKKLSDDERIENFFTSIRKSINSDVFDHKDFYEQVKFFLQKIKNDEIILRKTREPNHAKLYIFKLEEDQIGRNRLFITGSSNLTSAGLMSQAEFNVEISDYGFDEAESYFDELWNNAIKITENDELKEKIVKVIEQETLVKEITPFEAYLFVLKNYLDTFRGKEVTRRLTEVLEENGYKPYRYQLDAVQQALSIIENNNGVIIADVVGLGKTVIACSIAFELKKRGIVIAPPGIIGDKAKSEGWKKYLEQFHMASLGWEAFSLGDLEHVSEFVSKTNDIEVVIIDEAHRFRNEDTKDYEYLKNICRDKIVILLTATPFNNKPADIFSLLKLFIVPKKSSITLDDDLENKFRTFKSEFDKLSYIKRYFQSSDRQKRNRALSYYTDLFGEKIVDSTKIKKRTEILAKQIRNVIEPVIIRRNRLDIQNHPYYKNEVNELSIVESPKEWFYELNKEQSVFYDKIIQQYFALPDDGGRFKGAIYKPFEYELQKVKKGELGKEENFQYLQQFNLYDFMRRLLVKRFESSFGAFEQSVKNFINIHQIVLEFIQKTDKYILDRNLLEKIYELDADEIENYLQEYSEKIKNNEYPKNHKVYELKKFERETDFINDIQSDIALFQQILGELHKLNLVAKDPKAERLIEEVKTVLDAPPENLFEPKRKVIIFSEYADTVNYLAPLLTQAFNGRVLVVAGNLPASKIKEINKNFDATATQQADDYNILLTTDKISEGFNLNRAGMVINYDIPWNPVRVIQRIGRINRISKKVFDKLYIINFFPTEKGSDLVHSREIAAQKMFMIHNTLGEDAKIFDIDEEPTPSGLYNKIQQSPDSLEGESSYTKISKEFEAWKEKYPDMVASLKDFPSRIKVAKENTENELFVVIKKQKLFVHHQLYDAKEGSENHFIKEVEDVLEKIKADKNELPLPLSNQFWEEYETIKNYQENPKNNKPNPENSLQNKAIIVLRNLLAINDNFQVTLLKPFVRMLLEDLLDYGTLSDYTIRRIANIDIEKNFTKAVDELKSIEKGLGSDYLYKEKQRISDFSKEIIIAIENRKTNELPTQNTFNDNISK